MEDMKRGGWFCGVSMGTAALWPEFFLRAFGFLNVVVIYVVRQCY
jgi:hypothetical protein